MRVAVPVFESEGRLYVSPHFGRAPKFAIIEVESSRILEIFDNPIPPSQHGGGRGRAIAEALKARGVTAVVALGIGPGAYGHLTGAGIRVYYIPPKRGPIPIEEAIDAFKKGQVEAATGPREFEVQSQ